MSTAPIVLAGIQLVICVLIAPILVGVTRQTRAKLEGRAGAGVLQPWRDLRKLLRKDPVRSRSSSWVLRAGPVVLLISSGILAVLVPLVSTVPIPAAPGDLFVVVSVLLVGAVAVALVGLDGGTAFGGMGSSRHMTVLALVEPTILLSVYALSLSSGSSDLGIIIGRRLETPIQLLSPVSLFAMVALIIAVLAETGRLPVDNPSTHLELTMIHEAMVIESSARDLAWLELGAWLKLTVLLGLVANLIAPWGVATVVTPLGIGIGTLAIVAKVLGLGVLLSIGEIFLAKVRLFRVPELLAGSFVLAFLAVAVSAVVS